eukprot:Rhum_TRINITY_DN23539_c0_g1::Rhum_TRINITY_DN23539_c0_g1_i1::g.178163::m.178163/K02183/CALM; calmodulin
MSIGVSDIPTDMSDQWRDVYTQFTDGGEDISIRDFGKVIRAAGQCPTNEQLQLLIEDISGAEGEPDQSMRVTFQQFERAMANALNDWKTEEEFREALRTFDKDQVGYVPLAELRYFLTTSGDALEAEEMQELYAEASASGCFDSTGVNLSIDEFVKKIMPPLPGQ